MGTLQKKSLEQARRVLSGFTTGKILGTINYTLSDKKVGDEAIKAVIDAVSPELGGLCELVTNAREWIESVIEDMEKQ